MKNKGNFLRILLIVLLLCALLFTVPSSVSLAEIVEIPLDKNVMEPVDPANYLSQNEYKDESLHIVIETGRYLDTNYMTAKIKVANATQIRSSLATSNGKGTVHASTIAKRANAVLAINGDYYMFDPSVPKYIVRQGKVKKTKTKGVVDALIIDDQGDFTIIQNANKEDIEGLNKKLVNVYGFGPALVINGEVVTEFVDRGDAAFKQAKRMCIAQTAPLEYMVITTEGPEEKESEGLTLPQFAELCHSFKVQNAYNLDGGSSASLIFNGKKINALSNPKIRSVADIIYFASAVQGEK